MSTALVAGLIAGAFRWGVQDFPDWIHWHHPMMRWWPVVFWGAATASAFSGVVPAWADVGVALIVIGGLLALTVASYGGHKLIPSRRTAEGLDKPEEKSCRLGNAWRRIVWGCWVSALLCWAVAWAARAGWGDGFPALWWCGDGLSILALVGSLWERMVLDVLPAIHDRQRWHIRRTVRR